MQTITSLDRYYLLQVIVLYTILTLASKSAVRSSPLIIVMREIFLLCRIRFEKINSLCKSELNHLQKVRAFTLSFTQLLINTYGIISLWYRLFFFIFFVTMTYDVTCMKFCNCQLRKVGHFMPSQHNKSLVIIKHGKNEIMIIFFLEDGTQ